MFYYLLCLFKDDVELFLNLVNDNKTLIDSSKQDDKKKVSAQL